jgi:FixJ family two-component response regulator
MIAVIEDDVAVLHSLQFALEAQGYRVCAFERASEALSRPALQGVDCLVIDYGLPDLTGVALLGRLRKRGVTCPAVFIASTPTARCRREVAASGAQLVEKPLLGDVLGDQIRAML